MPVNRVPEFPYMLAEWLSAIPRQQRLAPIYLGGTSGSGGGIGQPPGGFIGQLGQSFVAYDTDEFALSSGSDSLVDNLNHIRFQAKPIRWFEPHQSNPVSSRVYVESGLWTHTENQQPLIFTGSHSPIITSGSADRVDVLYLTTSGSLLLSASVNTTPSYPAGTVLPIAEIYVRATSGSYYTTDQGVQGYIQRDVRPFLNLGASNGITGSGVVNRVPYFDSTSSIASDDQFRLIFDTSPDPILVIGNATANLFSESGFTARIQVIKDGAAGITSVAYTDTAALGGFISLGHARGSYSSPTPVQSGDALARVNALGYATSGSAGWAAVSGRLEALATENFTSGSSGTYWSFKATPAGTTAITEGLGVYHDRIEIVGSSLYLRADIDIDPTGAVANDILYFDGSQWTPTSGVFGGGAAGQVAYWSSADFLTGGSDFIFDGGNLTLTRNTASTPVKLVFQNNSDTSGADAQVQISVAGASGGDAYISFNVLSATWWNAGVDNSNADGFFIAADTGGGMTDWFRIKASDGLVTLPGSGLAVVGDIDMATGKWIGLSSGAGRIVFTDAATDTVAVTDANFVVGSTTTLNGTALQVANGFKITSAGGPRLDFNAADITFNGTNAIITTGQWLGLGASAGRIVFTDAATDTIAITSAEFQITTGAVTSGTYTPTLTGNANVAASTAYVCQYLRVGNVVTVSGNLDIDPTAAAPTVTEIRISLPIASNFSASNQCGGTAAAGITSPTMAAAIYANATNDTANMVFYASDAANRGWQFSFTYLVV